LQSCSPPAHRPDAWCGTAFHNVEEAVAAIAAGRFVVVVDAQSRENEGDLIIAADAVTPEAIEFMRRHTSGVICVSLPAEVCDRLALPLMVERGAEGFGTAFTITVDKRDGITTGISASDRAATLRALSDPNATADGFVRPGHVFPLRARPGGVLVRPGHTEAAHDLVAMAGRCPGGVLCEIVGPDGEMARRPELLRFARMHGLVAISIEQLIDHRRAQAAPTDRRSEEPA
jgi:3,4-dihydroxy 2-butanone 4-phosphate synthase / GTP cyclohydrolase II